MSASNASFQELPAVLPPAWASGRDRCVPDEVCFHPPALPSLEVMASWFDQGVARHLRFGPVPSKDGKRYFAFRFDVLGFDTYGQPRWRDAACEPFVCGGYEEADRLMERLGLQGFKHYPHYPASSAGSAARSE